MTKRDNKSITKILTSGPRTAMKSGPRTAMKSGPHLPQLEKALARTKDPAQPKINKDRKSVV